MYSVSDKYKTYIKKPSRSFECRITLNERIFTNEDIIKIVPQLTQPQNGFSIGNTVSQSIEITLKNDGNVYASVGKIAVDIGLKLDNVIEYVPQGIYNIDEVTKTDYTVKIVAYDNMYRFETPYISSVDNPTLQNVIDDFVNLTGVEFVGTVPNYQVTKLQGYTCREILSYVASVCGGNSYITRDGKFTIVYPHEVDCTITAANYIGSGYKIEDQIYKIGMITCQNKDSSSSEESYDSSEDKTTISVGSLSSDTMELTFKNPWVTESILTDIYNKLNGFWYLGYTLKWQGDLSLDPLDIITIIDKNNSVRKALVFENKLTYIGGLVADTSAKGETKNSNSFSSNGPGTKDIERLAVKLLIAEKAIITKATIQDLQATNAKIETLNASVATINTALINYAKVDQLDATNANIINLTADVAKISDALINKANIADLQAANANITNLNSAVANIQTLVNGNLTSANIHSLVLSSDKVTVDNGFITNAMIESLTVDKIKAGTINTNVINLSSSNGGLLIAGPTQQFRDKDNNVRLQMGQDTSGEFSFILKGKDGTSTLIDETGLHEGAIADGLIKTDMIADTAVTAEKIDYESVFRGFNADTNTNYIKSSKISIGLEGQTLDIAFNNVSTTVNGIKTTTDNNTTSISAIQGQISTLISNTTITKDGVTTQLKDAYSSLKETVDSMDLIIGDHTSYINSNTGQIESVSSKLLSLRTDLDGLRLDVTNTQTTLNSTNTQLATLQLSINGFDTRISTAESTVTNAITDINNVKTEIDQDINSITQTVQTVQAKTTDLENSINNSIASLTTSLDGITGKVTTLESSITDLQVGSRNYILASNFQENLYQTYWKLNDYDTIETYEYNNYSYNALVCDNTSDTWAETGQVIDSLQSNKEYTFSCMAYGEMYIQIWQVIYDSDNDRNDYICAEIEISNTSYERIVKTFKTSINVRYGYINIATNRRTMSKIALLKLEWGNIVSDWTPAPEDVDGQIKEIYSVTTSEIDILKNEIDLKVSETDFNNGISSLSAQISVQAGQIQNKVSADQVGTIITQSPTQVMTAFNKISTYFQVNASGATFGDTASGDYTTVGSYGLKHHVGSTNYDYFYCSYVGSGGATVPSGQSSITVTITHPSSIQTLFAGKKPYALASMSSVVPYGETFWGGVGVVSVTSTSITIEVTCYSYKLHGYTQTTSTEVQVYNDTASKKGGYIAFNYIMFA
ncbi:hypothetical protein [Clostridium saccharoperbutylacetonicum]|uniref:hypothetical protein n=1 Tax=Clostridium saccharoperbutylacetonicum TaxID=36745 RepID=UPI0039ED4B32